MDYKVIVEHVTFNSKIEVMLYNISISGIKVDLNLIQVTMDKVRLTTKCKIKCLYKTKPLKL